MQEEISIKDLYLLIKKHLFTLFALTLVGAIISLAFMNFFVDPSYESDTQILVNQRNPEQANINYNEIQTNLQLINTYRDIITSQELLSKVSEATGNVYEAQTLQSAISVRQSTNSQMFTVRVELPDPQAAQTVLAEITREFDQTLREIYQTDIGNIYILQPASFKPNPVSPSTLRYAAIGAAAGLALAVLFILISEMMDNTVRDDNFLQQLGLTNLGEIYVISNKEAKSARIQPARQKRGKA